MPFPRKDLRIGRSTPTRKPPGSTSNPAPPHARSRPFREVAAPGPTRPLAPSRAVVRMRGAVAGPPSNLPFHRGKSTPPCTPPRVRPLCSPSCSQLHRPPRGTSGPSCRQQWRENARPRTRGRSPRGRGGGAQARTVPGWAPGRPGSCLLLPQARGSRRANGCQPRARRPNEWPGAPRSGATVPPSGSLGRLGLVGGRVRVRAFPLLGSGSCPCRCPRRFASPNRLAAPGSPELPPCPAWSPWAWAGRPAGVSRPLCRRHRSPVPRETCPSALGPSGQLRARAAGAPARPLRAGGVCEAAGGASGLKGEATLGNWALIRNLMVTSPEAT